jgi:hypothetical protein
MLRKLRLGHCLAKCEAEGLRLDESNSHETLARRLVLLLPIADDYAVNLFAFSVHPVHCRQQTIIGGHLTPNRPYDFAAPLECGFEGAPVNAARAGGVGTGRRGETFGIVLAVLPVQVQNERRLTPLEAIR